MSFPSKKENASNDFFTEKIKLEQAVIDLEKIILDATVYLDTIDNSLAKMQVLSEENNSAYFLQRVKKLHVLFHSIKHKKSYHKDDFDPIYHILDKIKNEDRIEFLDSALKNRISKVAKTLVPPKSRKSNEEADLKNKEIFTAFEVAGVYFLIPKKPFRILRALPAFRSTLALNGKKINLFPGPGFILGSEERKGLKKDLLLVNESPTKEVGFYFDKLLDDWAISKDSLLSILKQEKGNERIIGKIRRKGINYHLIKLS